MPDADTAVATPEPTAPVQEAPEAPEQATPEQATPEQARPTPVRQKALTRREARQQLHEDLKQRRTETEQVEEEAEAPKGEQPEGEPQVAEGEPVAEGETPGETPKADEGEKPKTEEAAPIQVAIPDNHPIRAMGLEALTAASPEEEAGLRALVNGSYYRRRDVEQAHQQIAQLEDELARRDAQTSGWERYQQTPEYQAAAQEYHKLKELEETGDVPEGTATRYWKGINVDLQRVVDEEYQTRRGEMETKQAQRAAQIWASEAMQRTHRLPQAIRDLPRYQQHMDSALRQFDAAVQAGVHNEAKNGEDLHQRFSQFLTSWLLQQPDVQETLRAAKQRQGQSPAKAGDTISPQERERIKQEAIEEFRRDAAARRETTPTNPLGGMRGAAHTPAPSGKASDDDLAKLSPGQLKARLREENRQEARARFAQR